MYVGVIALFYHPYTDWHFKRHYANIRVHQFSNKAKGFWKAYLKFSGYDGIIIQGRAKRWVYLHINDNHAELRDADHLVGQDTHATDDLIKRELGMRKREMSVACIGVSGENLVKFAAIMADKGHVAAHNGPGQAGDRFFRSTA